MKKLPARRGCPKTVKSSQIPLTASLEADSLSWESTLGSPGVGSLGVFPGGEAAMSPLLLGAMPSSMGLKMNTSHISTQNIFLTVLGYIF